MKRKNILIIATTLLCTDGLTAVLLRLAAFAAEQNDIAFVLAEGATQDIIEKLNKIGPVHFLPSRKKSLPSYYWALTRLVKQNHYNIVHIHGNSATMAIDLLACRKVKARITHCHNWAKQPYLKTITLGKVLNRLVTHPVACSQRAGEALYTKPFAVIRNGIDIERFSFSSETREKVRKENRLQNAFVIGHIGRFTEQKNHKRLIQIFKAAQTIRPNSVLLLCGTGELEEKIRRQVIELDLIEKVCFAGVVPNPQDYLMAMDVLVLPSLFEGLPLVGIEAQATGLPCIFADTITKETTILPEVEYIPLNSTNEQWARAICRSRTLHREEAARKVAETGYGMDTVKEQIKQLYNSL